MKKMLILAALMAAFSCQKAGSSDPLLGRWAFKEEGLFYDVEQSTWAEVQSLARDNRPQFLQLNEGGEGVYDDRFVTWERKEYRQRDSLIIMQAGVRHAYAIRSLTGSSLVLRCGRDGCAAVLTYTRPTE